MEPPSLAEARRREPIAPRPAEPGARAKRQARARAGRYVVNLDAEPVLYVERGGRACCHCATGQAWMRPALEALAEAVKRARVPRLGIERFDGEPVVGSKTRSCSSSSASGKAAQLTLSA